MRPVGRQRKAGYEEAGGDTEETRGNGDVWYDGGVMMRGVRGVLTCAVLCEC